MAYDHDAIGGVHDDVAGLGVALRLAVHEDEAAAPERRIRLSRRIELPKEHLRWSQGVARQMNEFRDEELTCLVLSHSLGSADVVALGEVSKEVNESSLSKRGIKGT